MPLSPGTRLGAYEILSPLGAGGMGEVYRAKDSRLGRDVAIKVLPESVARDAERLARFEREARALAALNHPGIVTIFSVEESAGTRFLAMELVEGESLDTAIASGGLPLSRFLDIATPLAEALSAAHERSIVHRDLKPGNVMITREGHVKVLDFGLARVEDPGSDPNLTNTPTESRADLTGEGQVFGTVAYMSPEQARGGKVDARSDVFSLGIVLYQMLTGERPFQGASAVDMISSILRDRPPSVTDLRADLPPHLGRIVRRCLEKDPRDRYQTSRDVYNELKELRAENSSPASASPQRAGAAAGERPVSGAARAEDGFWVAVLPFKHGGSDPGLTALAAGLSEEIVTGLSRFSYLRVISHGSTSRYSSEVTDVRSVGRELDARYVLDGSLRQAGSVLRISVQLVDAVSGAHLWAETYTRPFRPEAVFELQDDVVPRVVSTIADWYGVLPHSMSAAVWSKSLDQLSPYEALLRGFGVYERGTVEAHAAARAGLERAVRQAPDNADSWAMLSFMYGEEFRFGLNALPDPLGRAFQAARRAVDAGPSNHFAYSALAQALYFRKEFDAFRSAAERAIALNPMDGATIEYMAHLIAFSGDWERGCELAERGRELNPNYPGWYWAVQFHNAYRNRDYAGARTFLLKSKNVPANVLLGTMLAAVLGQLGEREAAGKALRELLDLNPEWPRVGPSELEKWYLPDHVEHLMDGLRRAGLEIAAKGESTATAVGPFHASAPISGASRADEGFWIAVLPFKQGGASADLTALAEGLSEEIVGGLSRFSYLRVITSGSTRRYAGEAPDLREVGRELGARYVMNGSLRQAGTRLRVAVQLVDAATGAQLWAQTYERPFSPEAVFELQDDLVSRVVSTVGDPHGILPHTISESLRTRPAAALTPYEAVLRSFGFGYRSTAEEHAAVRDVLERAVEDAPGYVDAWAMLSLIYTHEHAHGFNLLPDPLGRALQAARRAADLAPSNALAYDALAWALFFRKEFPPFRVAAEQSIALNPLSSPTLAGLGTLIAYSGDWEKGCALVERAVQLNPRHPGWYRFALFADAYRKRDYRGAVDIALKLNLPDFFVTHEVLAAAYGQLGELEEARKALRELLRLQPDYPATGREKLRKWLDPEIVEHWIDGLRKAGLELSQEK